MSYDAEGAANLFALMQQGKDVAATAYVGLTHEAAMKKARNSGVDFRVGSLDGKPNMLTADSVFGRVTVTVQNGVVTSCKVE